jgi:hypothetical protein
MKHSILVALAVLTICCIDRAAAATAPFECDARPGETCFFKIYYTPRRTRIVQMLTGMKDEVPGVTIGGRYCVSVGKPPANKCAQKIINGSRNS